MLTKISKTFRWEMAHRLPFHDGGCRNLHGHSYSMTVELYGEPDTNGMVMDYFDLGAIVEPIIKEVDHSFFCDSSDSTVKDFLLENDFKAVFVEFPTTAENISQWFYDQLSDVLMVYKNLRSLRIVVCETERTSAEVSGELRVMPTHTRVLEHQSHMTE